MGGKGVEVVDVGFERGRLLERLDTVLSLTGSRQEEVGVSGSGGVKGIEN